MVDELIIVPRETQVLVHSVGKQEGMSKCFGLEKKVLKSAPNYVTVLLVVKFLE